MANFLICCLFAIFIMNLSIGCRVHVVPYDYAFTQECLAKPLAPQYNGGLVINPKLNKGLKGWKIFGDAKVEHVESANGNKYIVTSTSRKPFPSFLQKFNLEKEKLYTFSAWLKVSHGNADIAAVFKAQNGDKIAGWVTAQSSCWSMLKGGFVVNTSIPAYLILKSNNTDVQIWAESISLQPFTQEEWKSHQLNAIETARKGRVKLQVLDQQNRPIQNATVLIKQIKPKFALGCTINPNVLTNAAYGNWFTSRFKFTVFENELKWYVNEKTRGIVDYAAADALTKFAKANRVAIRGHNVHWDNPTLQPSWVRALSPADLEAVVDKRINSVVGRYRGQFIHWDVVNENLHFNFFESKLGATASSVIYQKANRVDGRMTPFLIDFGIIEYRDDAAVSPGKYLQRIAQIRAQGYKGPLGIGLEGHFGFLNHPNAPDLPYMRSALDQLASAKLPIWVTELDVGSDPNQAKYLDQILRELHAHHAVEGVMIWGAWTPKGCFRMCLTDNNFKNLATGDVVDKILGEWKPRTDLPTTTDSSGFFEATLFHGEYEAKITHPKVHGFAKLHKFDVTSDGGVQNDFHFKIDA